MMPQLLREHSNHLSRTGLSQPVLVQIDIASADGIGPSRSRHGARWHQHDRRNPCENPRGPLRHQLLKCLRHPTQQQSLLGGSSEATTGRPTLKQQLPIGKQRREQFAGSAVACQGIHL